MSKGLIIKYIGKKHKQRKQIKETNGINITELQVMRKI